MGLPPDLSVETEPGRRSPATSGERALVALFAGVVLVTAVVVLLNVLSGGQGAAVQSSPSPGMETDPAASPTPAPPSPTASEVSPSLPSLRPIPSVASNPTLSPGTDPWLMDAQHYRGQIDGAFAYACPAPAPADLATNPAYVFGTDIYSDDSWVCAAAVHAGIISLDGGGEVTIAMRPGQLFYQDSVRNGITTQVWRQSWPGSFVFVDP